MSYARHARMHVHRRACADACRRCERRTGTCWAPSDRRPVRRSALPYQRTRVAIMTAVNVASTYLGFRWIDGFGRRKLAIGGYTGMITFALVSALGLAFLSGTAWLVVIMIGLDFLIASFAIGVGGIGWTLQGEVFPTAVRGQAAALCAMIDWLANFALIEVFPVWQNAISLGGVMVCFAALALAAIAFVYWFLPETKGLPVEEIVRVFERQKGTAATVTYRPAVME